MKPTLTEQHNLVNQLKAARERAGLSRTCIAKRARVSRGLIQRVEEETRTPSKRVLTAYALLCALDADCLLLAWGHAPDDVLTRLQQNPQLCALVRSA